MKTNIFYLISFCFIFTLSACKSSVHIDVDESVPSQTFTITESRTPTSTFIPLPTATLVPTLTPSPTSTLTPTPKPIGPLLIEANSEKGFHWPYYLYVPSLVTNNHILVYPNNTGYRSNDFSEHKKSAEDTIYWRRDWADKLGVPLIVPVFPRPDDDTDGTIASQYMGRGTLEDYLKSQYPSLARQDLQLISMVDDARERLKLSGIDTDEKIMLSGYSASAMFVSRFTILQPERVQAAAFGGHGWAIVPVAQWEGLYLPYPYGVSDFESLVGQPFNLDAFKNVPIYAYMGENDDNGWALPWYIGAGVNRSTLYNAFVSQFGSSSASLMSATQNIYDEVGCSASFVLYPSVGHSPITSEMDTDVLEFLRANLGE